MLCNSKIVKFSNLQEKEKGVVDAMLLQAKLQMNRGPKGPMLQKKGSDYPSYQSDQITN